MIKINLLTEKFTPARVSTRLPGASSRNLIFAVLGVLTVAAIGYLWYSNTSTLSRLDADLVEAKAERESLQKIIRQVEEFDAKKQELSQKIDIISDLKKRQAGPVHLLDEVSKALPNLVWLTAITQRGDGIQLDGESITLNAVADFIENLRRSRFIESPDLANSVERQGIVVFNITFLFKQSEEKTEEKTGEEG
jgi:type IV pilus assembly protein PilN